MNDTQSVVLLVEDNHTNLEMMRLLVAQMPNCAVLAFSSPTQVRDRMGEIGFDLAIIDYQMPDLNGVELVRLLRDDPRHANKPTIMVTADLNQAVRREAIEAGVVDFLNKPVEPYEFRLRVRNLLRLADAMNKLDDRARQLHDEVMRATGELRAREEEIVLRLSMTADFKDRETAAHTLRVARYAGIIADELGLDQQTRRDIELAAPMHDIGKVGIRDEVLLKPGRLNEAEVQHMRTHTLIGAQILSGSKSALLKLASDVALGHHERWDGTGYPSGLAQATIPLAARIVAVADVFDALTTERPYKSAWSIDRALAHLTMEAGRQFDPACVIAFLNRRADVETIMNTIPDIPRISAVA